MNTTPTARYIQSQALESAARLLKHAAEALPLHVPHPIFKKTITLNISGVKRK